MTDDVAQAHEPQDAPHRKKYTFKKRDPVAAAKLEEERVASIKHNPFGDAKPRESVIAKRTGKDEAKVLEEEALTYEVHFKLTPEQFAEKKARQEEIQNLKASLDGGEVDDAETVKAEISEKESALEQLVKGFEQLLVEKAKAGDMPRVERKPFMRGDEAGGGGGGAYNEDGAFSSRPSNRGVPYRDQYDAGGGGGGGYGGAFGGGHHGDDSQRGDSFGAGYGGGGGGGGYNRRRGGGRGGAHREYRDAGGHREGGGFGGGADGGFSSYGSRNDGGRGGFGGDGGGGYHRHYPMHADSEDYHPLSER